MDIKRFPSDARLLDMALKEVDARICQFAQDASSLQGMISYVYVTSSNTKRVYDSMRVKKCIMLIISLGNPCILEPHINSEYALRHWSPSRTYNHT